ncbi:hypothetical protein BDW66DRAFT_40521 [Aspergillus desertorum]
MTLLCLPFRCAFDTPSMLYCIDCVSFSFACTLKNRVGMCCVDSPIYNPAGSPTPHSLATRLAKLLGRRHVLYQTFQRRICSDTWLCHRLRVLCHLPGIVQCENFVDFAQFR